jgi:hypothetical protein
MEPLTVAAVVLLGLGLVALVAYVVNVRRHHPENLADHDEPDRR